MMDSEWVMEIGEQILGLLYGESWAMCIRF